MPIAVLNLNPDGLAVAVPHIRDECHRSQLTALPTESVDQGCQHVTAQWPFNAGIAGDHSHFAIEGHRHPVGKELVVLVKHLLGEGEGIIQKPIYVVLGLLGGRVAP